MKPHEQQLREQALLLLRREREVFTLRAKHERITSWLRLTQSLPALTDRRLSLDASYAGLRRALIAGLGVQRVTLFELGEQSLRPIAPASAERPLAPGALAAVEAQKHGACNPQRDDGLAALAASVGLEQFLWARIRAQGSTPILLVVGFDKDKVRFQSPFDESDTLHFGNMAQHVETLLGNLLLVNELDRDRERLRQFNESLDRLVAERTEELGHANREIAAALRALTEKDARLGDDLEEARNFQQGILPTLPQSPRVAFEAIYQPVALVGGDIFDVCEVAPGQFRVFLADATGHGVQASLRTIVLKSEYDRLKEDPVTPDVLLARYNDRLVAMFPRNEMLSTGCCFDIDFRAGAEPMLRYANAAHPALLCVSGGKTEEIYMDGPYLGVRRNIRPGLIERPVSTGDLLLACSDGLSDQLGGSGETFDLHHAARTAAEGCSLPDKVRALLEQFERFCGGVPASDDVTLVAAHVRPQG